MVVAEFPVPPMGLRSNGNWLPTPAVPDVFAPTILLPPCGEVTTGVAPEGAKEFFYRRRMISSLKLMLHKGGQNDNSPINHQEVPDETGVPMSTLWAPIAALQENV